MNSTLPFFSVQKILGGLPSTMYAPFLAALHREEKKPVLFITSNDVHMARLQEHLDFFAPGLRVSYFPAWDCLPYEWISPRADLSATRLARLSQWAHGQFSDIVIATAASVLQFLPPRSSLQNAFLTLEKNTIKNRTEVEHFLEEKGYLRTHTVREVGEYALRGSLIDIFPGNLSKAVRIDFFGNQIDSIRYFDPETQRRQESVDKITLSPVEEILFSQEYYHNFRQSYRLHTGTTGEQDMFYQSLSEGHRHPGYEHWMPLFYTKCQTILDYLPENQIIIYSESCAAAFETHHDLVNDNHYARKQAYNAYQREIQKKPKRGSITQHNAILKPLPPHMLYLDTEKWHSVVQEKTAFLLQTAPEAVWPHIPFQDQKGRGGADFSGLFRVGKLYMILQERLEYEKRPLLFLAYSTGSRERLKTIFQENDFLFSFKNIDTIDALPDITTKQSGIAVMEAERGFVSENLVVITERDIFGERLGHSAKKSKKKKNLLTRPMIFLPNDYVVHEEHGIGHYQGLENVVLNDVSHDCLVLLYAEKAKLFVPVENMDCLSSYGKDSENEIPLDRLGNENWQQRKSKMRRQLRDMADELVKVAAERSCQTAPVFSISKKDLWESFCAGFPFVETEEQLDAIKDVLEDISSGRVMDRLICGSAGVGKTEIALRAIFPVVMAGFQAIMIAPTTLLARQHYENFKKRFESFDITLFLLTRHTSQAQAKKIHSLLKEGKTCVVIGTHSLLSEKISFAHLGLTVVDEEQRFGVAQKERLKKLHSAMHLLTLTATPIPRSLQMALTGIRELSLISQPPLDRLSIRSFIIPFDPVIIAEALRREHIRGGQVFCVCPRRSDMPEAERTLRKLAPTLSIVTVHGKMKASEIEKTMEDFVKGRVDILLSTPIVESGLDIPRANTMIILRAHMFGLAQLYQLRGRIGRSKIRGYCYFTLPQRQNITQDGEKRLDFMRALDAQGAGFHLAYHDMDMRGAGNLLGEEQSGHIPEIGVGLYQKMLTQAIEQARKTKKGHAESQTNFSPRINLGLAVMLPPLYITEAALRMELYSALSHCSSHQEIDMMGIDMIDRFGKMPEETTNLLLILKIRLLCKQAGIEKLESGPQGMILHFFKQRFANPAGLARFLNESKESLRLRPDHGLIYKVPLQRVADKIKCALWITEKLMKIATS